ncbi:PEGA domain-containing protein [Eubacterium oxidoreducens]|uniref:PEGA domain-containing protein n=1 Tax=Eubacterium oxidoreducens TaxID=1732 RepID=A0A1G6BTC4_EUBOX|nr:PEGA domain-containing protein [Eubacterium oxidoreducens]SDB23845.1 PEGA domain-containing protein [Eubacterium oxidoreducens]
MKSNSIISKLVAGTLSAAMVLGSGAIYTLADEDTSTPYSTEDNTSLTDVAMSSSTSIGGITYYYVDASSVTNFSTVEFRVDVTNRRSSTTTSYYYPSTAVTQISGTNYYYVAAPGSTPLSGALYGYDDETGTATTYADFYSSKGVTISGSAQEEFDAVTSATNYTSHHAGDISSLVTFGTSSTTDETTNETTTTYINGLKLGRTVESVDADTYVEAGIKSAAGLALTTEQEEALALTLKENPTVAPSATEVTPVVSTASYTSSKYGTGEFVISFDDTVDGWTWSEYWDNVYAATISDGTNTAGTVHWIDLYGEMSTSGAHYNKLEISVNNGESVGSNAATVTRFADFYDDNNELKAGDYTITVYAEGYETITATVTVKASTVSLDDMTAVYTGEAISADGAKVTVGEDEDTSRTVTYTYYKDAQGTQKINASEIVNAGTYYVKASVSTGTNMLPAESDIAKLTITKADSQITLADKTVIYTGKAVAADTATVSGSTGAVTYNYYTDKACTKEIKAAQVVNAGTYYVKATVAADTNYASATSNVAKITIKKAAGSISAKATTKKVKVKKLKKKAIKLSVVSASKTGGKLTYSISGSKKLSINKNTGKITVKKKTKKGTYAAKVTIKSQATTNYTAASKTIEVKVKVVK